MGVNCRERTGEPHGSVSFQKLSKFPDDTLYHFDKLVERWNQRLRLSNLCLADRFIDSRLEIFFHVRTELGEIRVVSFEMVNPWQPTQGENGLRPDCEKVSVLVDIVKCVKSPEQGGELSIPASIRLESIDSLYCTRMNSLYFSSLGSGAFVFGESLRYGKLDSSEFLASKRRSVNQGQVLCEVIKCRPEVVNHVSCHADGIKANCGNHREVPPKDSNRMWRDTRLFISDEYCRLCYGEGFCGEIT